MEGSQDCQCHDLGKRLQVQLEVYEIHVPFRGQSKGYEENFAASNTGPYLVHSL